jgi:hypothetical protein
VCHSTQTAVRRVCVPRVVADGLLLLRCVLCTWRVRCGAVRRSGSLYHALHARDRQLPWYRRVGITLVRERRPVSPLLASRTPCTAATR